MGAFDSIIAGNDSNMALSILKGYADMLDKSHRTIRLVSPVPRPGWMAPDPLSALQPDMTVLVEIAPHNIIAVQCHSYILSYHSPRFRGMISPLWQQNLPIQISLTDYVPSVVESMLEFIYTGSCNVHRFDDPSVCEVMLLADWLGIQDLRVQCLIAMRQNLHPVNIQHFVTALVIIELRPSIFFTECLNYMCHPAVLEYVIHDISFYGLDYKEMKLILGHSHARGISPLLLRQAIRTWIECTPTRQEKLPYLYKSAGLQQRRHSEQDRWTFLPL